MKLKDCLVSIWHDPVCSKVIAGIILAVMGLLYSIVRGLINDSETIVIVLKTVFGYKVNIWIVVAIIWIALIIFDIYKKKKKKSEDVPVCPFVDDFTEGTYQNQKWVWLWKWSKDKHFYYIADLCLKCPDCKDGLLTMSSMSYRCGKCNADIPYGFLKTNSDAVENQIFADAKRQYAYYAKYIGKIETGFIHA